MTLQKILLAIGLALTLIASGCTSSGSVSGYGGPSVSSVSVKRDTAKRDVRKAVKIERKAKRETRKLEKLIQRDERRLKRKSLSETRKATLEKRLKKNRKALKAAKREERRATQQVASAERRERRAIRNLDRAKDRQARAKAAAQRRREREEKRVAELERKANEEEARERSPLFLNRDEKPSTSSRIFALADPAFKNVSDYRSRTDGGWNLPAIPVEKMSKRLLRQQVRYSSPHKPGTIIVDTGARFLYLVQGGGRAMRYGIGVGREGFAWSGTAHIGWKQQWPKWTPPVEMIERQPELAKYCADCGGMPGGISNPLGARALYLMKDGKDTLFRLHGTPQWASIGTAASSGCIRLINQDIIDLYDRVGNGTKVVVI